jgi:two-component system, chemotaxis family, response regulator PixG
MILKTLTEELHNLDKRNNDGELILSSHQDSWRLHISDGRLLYPENAHHRVRRWSRALRKHCYQWQWELDFLDLPNQQCWEYKLLDLGICQKRLSLIQAKLIIRTIVQEFLFELSSQTEVKTDWKICPIEVSSSCNLIALSSLEMQPIFARTAMMDEAWKAANLGSLRPILSPVLRQGNNSQTLPISDQHLNANFTLWDIACLIEKSVTEATLSLMPFVKSGVLELRQIPDSIISASKQAIEHPIALSKTADQAIATENNSNPITNPIAFDSKGNPIVSKTTFNCLY